MPDETVVATEPSSVQTDLMAGMTPAERSNWRKTGEIPAPPKKGESESPDSQEKSGPEAQAAERAPQSGAEKPQESQKPKPKPKLSAEERISELTAQRRTAESRADTAEARNRDLEARIAALEKGKTAEPPKPEPVEAKEEEYQPLDPEKYFAEHKDATWEDYSKADSKQAAKWAKEQAVKELKAEQEKDRHQSQMTEQSKQIAEKLAEGKARYKDFDEVMPPTMTAIMNDQNIPVVVKALIGDSEILPDLLYALGQKKEDFDKFLNMAKTAPGKALRYIANVESLVMEELEKSKGSGSPNGAEKPASPVTRAPKPVSEVSGRNVPPDDAAASAVAANDFRSAKAEWNRRALAATKA